MKKFVFALVMAFVFFSCDNGGVEKKEENPYPDGVYPFEVSGVSHTYTDGNYGSRDYIITWETPDNGFDHVQFEMFFPFEANDERGYHEDLAYSSSAPLTGFDDQNRSYWNVELTKNSLSFETMLTQDQLIIIKCVDKFGNVSKGVKYVFCQVN